MNKPLFLNRKVIYIIILVISSVVFYANSLNNGYNIDDKLITENNSKITKGISGIPEILFSHYRVGDTFKYGYRPISQITYAIEYEIFGANPQVSHIINLIIYILSSIFIFFLLSNYSGVKSYIFPFLVSFIFIIHPIHTEVVCSLKNREELLSFLFAMLSLWLFVKYIKTNKVLHLILAFLLFIISYLSKENAITFIIIIPLFIYSFVSKKINKPIIIFISLFITVFTIRKLLSIYLPSEKESLFIENPLFFTNSLNERIGTSFLALLEYLKLSFVPHNLKFYYGYNIIPITGILNIKVIISILIHLSAGIFSIIRFNKNRIISFAILFYIFSISMFSNLYVPVNGIVAERLLYFASFGICIIISLLIFNISGINYKSENLKFKKPNYTFLTILLLITSLSFYQTYNRNKNWKDNLSLVSNDIKYLEESAIANEIYASQWLNTLNRLETANARKKKIKDIINHYEKALKLYPKFHRPLNNLGFIYLNFYNNPDKAIPYFNKAIKAKPNYASAYFQLGMAYEIKKDFNKAVELYKKAYDKNPNYKEALAKLANWAKKQGEIRKAIKLNKKIYKIDPESEIPFINLGNYFYMADKLEKAAYFWDIAIQKNPDLYRIYFNIGNCYKSLGKLDLYNKYYSKGKKVKNKLSINK